MNQTNTAGSWTSGLTGCRNQARRQLGDSLRNHTAFLLFEKFHYLFLRERERERARTCEEGKGRERGRDRIPCRLPDASAEPDLGLRSHRP